MRILPRISLSAHALLLQATGLALVLAAVIADFGGAGVVTTFVGGVVLAGLGLGAAEHLPLPTLRSLDLVLVMAFAVGAVICAVGESAAAAVVMLAVAVGLLVLETATRWSRPVRRG